MRLVISEPMIIMPDDSGVDLFQAASGALLLRGLRSDDSGRTWQPNAGANEGRGPAYRTKINLSDGSILGLARMRRLRADHFAMDACLSFDDWKGLSETFEAAVHIPGLAGGGFDDQGEYHGSGLEVTDGLELPDGALAIVAYGYLDRDRSDGVMTDYTRYPEEWQFHKYRTVMLKSQDRGRTWEAASTVACDPHLGWEGFCEGTVVLLDNGDLLCVMRNGEHGAPGEEMFQARSRDLGRTWEPPERLIARGVWPRARRLANGILVCAYGRPGCQLMVSLEGDGTDWQYHPVADDRSRAYSGIAEVGEGEVLYVHDRRRAGGDAVERNLKTPGESSSYSSKCIQAVRIRVETGEARAAFVNGLGMEMVAIQAGSFLMGSSPVEAGRDPKEGMEREHLVTLTSDYFLGKHAVTDGEYRRFMDETDHEAPSGTLLRECSLVFAFRPLDDPDWNADDQPVVCVSWDDAQAFCEWLSAREGRTYGLPTEAEWEYACRAGTTSRYHWGDAPDPSRANYAGSGPGRPVAVGSYPPNPWGLCDMHGNVWEWCADWWNFYGAGDAIHVDPAGPGAGGFKAGRGGGWVHPADRIRSACRCSAKRRQRLASLGFRVRCR